MSDPTNSHWRNMFDQGRGNNAPPPPRNRPAPTPGYDDGYQPPPHSGGGNAPLSPADITDEAAMALAHDPTEYKPWILQRGRSRPAMLLHLRRYEPKSGLWMGWQMSYPHLIGVEYTGDTMLSLDFGTRQFVIEGTGLTELASHLQAGSVLVAQEYAVQVWERRADGAAISSITKISAI